MKERKEKVDTIKVCLMIIEDRKFYRDIDLCLGVECGLEECKFMPTLAAINVVPFVFSCRRLLYFFVTMRTIEAFDMIRTAFILNGFSWIDCLFTDMATLTSAT